MRETRVWSLGQEDLLEKEMATHSNILATGNSMDRRAWQPTVHGVTKGSDTTWQLNDRIVDVPPRSPCWCAPSPTCPEYWLTVHDCLSKELLLVLHMLKNAESETEQKDLDADSLVTEHIQVNKAPKMRRRTYRAHGRINRPHWNDPYWKKSSSSLNRKRRLHRRKRYPRRNWKNKNLCPGNKCHKNINANKSKK